MAYLVGYDFAKSDMSKDDYKKQRDGLIQQLIMAQQEAIRAQRGVVVLFEGWAGSGRGTRISDIVYHLDARATDVYVTPGATDVAEFRELGSGVSGFYPLMQEFWQALGQRGHMTFFDRGWYAKAAEHVVALHEDGADSAELSDYVIGAMESVHDFESALAADGYRVVKFFLHVSHEAQLKRLRVLRDNPATAWRAPKSKFKSAEHYDEELAIYDKMLAATDFDFAPWIVLNGQDKRTTTLQILQTLIQALNGEGKAADKEAHACETVGDTCRETCATIGADTHEGGACERSHLESWQDAKSEPFSAGHVFVKPTYKILAPIPTVETVCHDLVLDEADYRVQLKELQGRLFELESRMYQVRVPMLIMYEGWDAAGKGGNIKRVAQALDARAYTIYPSPAPTPQELAHPHLWRYWTRLPKAGHVGIYDRSWYGRVLVERVEGITPESRWREGYNEINDFERDLIEWGAILVKFWVDISPDTQLDRFEARQVDPFKTWKITDEDWRNRDKHPQYVAAVNEMFERTHTPWAPWQILESDDKRYARIKALKVLVKALEDRLG
jgi:polyphosphate kinase 2 (PPK2 family)